MEKGSSYEDGEAPRPKRKSRRSTKSSKKSSESRRHVKQDEEEELKQHQGEEEGQKEADEDNAERKRGDTDDPSSSSTIFLKGEPDVKLGEPEPGFVEERKEGDELKRGDTEPGPTELPTELQEPLVTQSLEEQEQERRKKLQQEEGEEAQLQQEQEQQQESQSPGLRRRSKRHANTLPTITFSVPEHETEGKDPRTPEREDKRILGRKTLPVPVKTKGEKNTKQPWTELKSALKSDASRDTAVPYSSAQRSGSGVASSRSNLNLEYPTELGASRLTNDFLTGSIGPELPSSGLSSAGVGKTQRGVLQQKEAKGGEGASGSILKPSVSYSFGSSTPLGRAMVDGRDTDLKYVQSGSIFSSHSSPRNRSKYSATLSRPTSPLSNARKRLLTEDGTGLNTSGPFRAGPAGAVLSTIRDDSGEQRLSSRTGVRFPDSAFIEPPPRKTTRARL